MTDINNRDKKFSNMTDGDMSDLIFALRSNIMRHLNVATFAEVVSVDKKNHTITVTPFPLLQNEQSKNIICFSSICPVKENDDISYISFENILEKKDVVLIVFTNRNSIQSFRQSLNNQQRSVINNNAELHSDSFGVVVSLCYKYKR